MPLSFFRFGGQGFRSVVVRGVGFDAILAFRVLLGAILDELHGGIADAATCGGRDVVQIVECSLGLAEAALGLLEALVEHLDAVDQFVGGLHDLRLILGLLHLSPGHDQHTQHHI